MGKTRPQREMGYGFGAADLVEADQVESKVLDPVEQAVEFAVVPAEKIRLVQALPVSIAASPDSHSVSVPRSPPRMS
jgi:hypothetical protein